MLAASIPFIAFDLVHNELCREKGTKTHVLNLRECEMMRLLGKHDNASAELEQARLHPPLSAEGEYVGVPYENSRIFNCYFVRRSIYSK